MITVESVRSVYYSTGLALEDAKLFRKDINALIVDFTSTLNTTDHGRMLWIMYNLGFPADAINAAKISMYMPPLK